MLRQVLMLVCCTDGQLIADGVHDMGLDELESTGGRTSTDHRLPAHQHDHIHDSGVQTHTLHAQHPLCMDR